MKVAGIRVSWEERKPLPRPILRPVVSSPDIFTPRTMRSLLMEDCAAKHFLHPEMVNRNQDKKLRKHYPTITEETSKAKYRKMTTPQPMASPVALDGNRPQSAPAHLEIAKVMAYLRSVDTILKEIKDERRNCYQW